MNTLKYTVSGKGFPVVFLHGFLEDQTMWNTILPHFNAIQSICIDLPGHGASDGCSGECSLNTLSRQVKRLLSDIIPDKRFSIVGHSLGGYVALNIARDHDLSIKKIILLHSHPFPDPEEKKKDRTRVANIVDYNKLLFIKEAIPGLFYQPQSYTKEIITLISRASKMEKENIIQTIYAMRDRERNTAIFDKFGKNLHVIQGEFDSLIDAKMMGEYMSTTACHFHLIESIGHMGHIEAQEKTIAILHSILK